MANSPAALELSSKAIRFAILNYANWLISDLGLPASVTASIDVVTDDEIPREWPFLMTIAGKQARIHLLRERRPFEERIPHEIYRNRSLLLTPDVVNAYALGLWGTTEPSSRSMETLLDAMRACFERNIGLERLSGALANKDPGTLDTWALVFVAHCDEALQISLSFHPERYRELTVDQGLNQGTLVGLQKQIFEQTGLLCPIPETRRAPELSRDEWYSRINDVRLPVRSIEQTNGAGMKIAAALQEQLLSEPQILFTRQGVERNLDFLRQTSPVLVEEVIGRVGLNTVCLILESLVREGFPVKSLGRVLDMLSFAGGTHQADTSKYIVFTSDVETSIWSAIDHKPLTPEEYLRAVRANLKREITYRYAQEWKTDTSPTLVIYLLDSGIEKRIQISDEEPLTDEERIRLVRSFLSEMPPGHLAARRPPVPMVVLTREEIRHRLWALIHLELPDVTVLAYQDLSPNCNIQPKARISLDNEGTAQSAAAK